jgi:hypothetical protein
MDPSPTRASKASGRLKRAAGNLALLVISIVLTLAAFEVFLRVFYAQSIDLSQMSEFDSELGWRLIPGTYTVRNSQALVSHEIYINSLGMRNREISLQPPSGTRRAVLLGDSFTFGMIVPTDGLLSSVAEAELAERCDHPIEVVNTGRTGYGTTQHYLLTRRLQA